MALSDYSGLVASVAGWLHRTDLTARIPDFIALAEAQMNRRLRVREMVAQAALSLGGEYEALPSDFIEERSLVLSTDPPAELIFETSEALDQRAQARPSAYTAQPRLYSVVGTDLRLYPIPNETYAATLNYFQRIPALTADAPTNWLLASHPDAYLYGTLLQSAPYLRDDGLAATWAQLFETVVADIQKASGERRGRKLRVDPGLMPRRSYDFMAGC